jgi:hypothetical protein
VIIEDGSDKVPNDDTVTEESGDGSSMENELPEESEASTEQLQELLPSVNDASDDEASETLENGVIS